MFYYYNEDNGQVRMVSAEYMETPFQVVEIDDNDYEGYSIVYANGELIKTKIS